MTAAALQKLQRQAHEVAGLLKMLSHPNRLLIACDLMRGEKSVGDIETATGVRQPGLSRELARLREDGLVATRRESKVVFYHISDERLRRLMDLLCGAFGDGPAVGPASGAQTANAPQPGAASFARAEADRPRRVRINPNPYRKV